MIRLQLAIPPYVPLRPPLPSDFIDCRRGARSADGPTSAFGNLRVRSRNFAQHVTHSATKSASLSHRVESIADTSPETDNLSSSAIDRLFVSGLRGGECASGGKTTLNLVPRSGREEAPTRSVGRGRSARYTPFFAACMCARVPNT